jgi:P pilus assembly chaperone PapD
LVYPLHWLFSENNFPQNRESLSTSLFNGVPPKLKKQNKTHLLEYKKIF